MQKRCFLNAALAFVGTTAMGVPLAALAKAKPKIEVWKTASCGCCHDWVKHMEMNGFELKVNDITDAAKSTLRAQLGLAEKYGSCHTALINGYVLEGHVPAKEVHRLLKERPKALGLSVPGMTIGSPGMDGPDYKGRKDPYSVLLVQRNGSSTSYQAYL
jgi:hypothetical protein